MCRRFRSSTWTGIYIGGQVGYAWASGRNQLSPDLDGRLPVAVFTANVRRQNTNGVIGGAHVGYNYQINQWVLGLEGSVDGTSLKQDRPWPPLADLWRLRYRESRIRRSISRVRSAAVLGVAWDRVLIYATGGVAFGGFNTDYHVVSPTSSATPVFGSGSFSTTRVGWTVGGGLQYAVTNNWSVRAEYRYTDFGRATNTPFSTAFAPFGGGFTGHHHFTQNQVQVGFSYKFDTFAPVPVVAKY